MFANMFGGLHRETVEILAEKVADYPFGLLGPRTNKATLDGSDTSASQSLYNYVLDQESQINEIKNDERISSLKKCLQKLELLNERQEKCKNISFFMFLASCKSSRFSNFAALFLFYLLLIIFGFRV